MVELGVILVALVIGYALWTGRKAGTASERARQAESYIDDVEQATRVRERMRADHDERDRVRDKFTRD